MSDKAINLTKALNDILSEYVGDVTLAAGKATADVAKGVVKTLKTTGGYEDKTGEYRKSFRTKKYTKGMETGSLVYASGDQAEKTYLLEYGHAKRNGGRTRAFPHWKPAEEKAIEDFKDRLLGAIEEVSG